MVHKYINPCMCVCVCVCVCVCARTLACQNCLFPCNRVVYLNCRFVFNSNSKFKRISLAEKALVLNFVPDPRVRER